MKKLIAMAAMAFAGLASAGDYHVYTKLICSDCHTMHHSRTHVFGGTAADTTVGAWSAANNTGNAALLLRGDVNQTCLVCHNADGAPDVFGDNALNGYNRAGGALNSAEAAIPNEGVYDQYMGHSLGATTAPPGYDPALIQSVYGLSAAGGIITDANNPFECSTCHSVHGNEAFRNLGARTIGSGGPSWPRIAKPGYAYVSTIASLNLTKDVNLLAAPGTRTYVTSQEVYTAAIGDGITNGTYKMDKFCGMCHGVFHSQGTDTAGTLTRHPTSTTNFTNSMLWDKDDNLLKLVIRTNTTPVTAGASTGKWNYGSAADGASASQYSVGCLTCHKGHGTRKSFGLVFPADLPDATPFTGAGSSSAFGFLVKGNDSADLESGSGQAVNQLCWQCHGMGRRNYASP